MRSEVRETRAVTVRVELKLGELEKLTRAVSGAVYASGLEHAYDRATLRELLVALEQARGLALQEAA